MDTATPTGVSPDAPRAVPRAAQGQAVFSAVTAVLLLVGLVLAYGQRDAASPVAAVLVLVTGTAFGLAAAAWGVVRSRAPHGLALPADGDASWPVSPWWWLVGATGVIDLLAGPLVSGALGLVGLVLLAAALLGLGLDLRRPEALLDRGVVRAARRLHTVLDGGSRPGPWAVADPAPRADRPEDAASPAVAAAVAPLGAFGARVTVFDRRGRLVDVVLPDVERAELAVRVAGLTPVSSTAVHPPARTG